MTLTIAAGKGHYRFVKLLLRHAANVDVKNKKGNSPLWLASNGTHIIMANPTCFSGFLLGFFLEGSGPFGLLLIHLFVNLSVCLSVVCLFQSAVDLLLQ